MVLTKTLQIFFALILGLILLFWFVDIFVGTSAKVSDQSITNGWAEDNKLYASKLTSARLRTLIYAMPTLILLILTIYSYRRKNEKLFF